MTQPRKFPRIAVATLISCHLFGMQTLRAADITQIANSGNGWNDAAYWGSAATAGNNYFSSTGHQTLTNELTIVRDGFVWSFSGTVRDNLAGSGSFAGDSLTLVENTRLLGKVKDGGTSDVNLIFGGGFYMSGVNDPNGSAILSGTMSFASGTDRGAIAVNPNVTGTMQLTVSSTLIGDSSDTLELVLFKENPGTRLGQLIFNGNITGFGGTIYVGTALSGTDIGSYFSVQSSSVTTTLYLDTVTPNFFYRLDTSETFGSVIVGNTTLEAGVYTADSLNSTFGTFFDGTGTITVVPEPSTMALCAIAAFGALATLRYRVSRRNNV